MCGNRPSAWEFKHGRGQCKVGCLTNLTRDGMDFRNGRIYLIYREKNDTIASLGITDSKPQVLL